MLVRYEKGNVLVVFIIIVALVGAFGYVVLRSVRPEQQYMQMRDTQRKDHLLTVQKGIEEYYREKGQYPFHSTRGNLYRIATGIRSEYIEWGEAWLPYIQKLPKDPEKDRTYVYYSSGDRQSYYLYASLERGDEDEDTCKTFDTVCEGVKENGIEGNACGGPCNYGITSPNVSP